jgi:hypothetical protein
MEGASVPNVDDTKPDAPKPDGAKPDDPQGAKRADGALSHAYAGIKNAQEELARLDQVVSRMERGDDARSIRQNGTGVEPGGAPVSEAPAPPKTTESKVPPPAERRGRPMLLALVGFLLAIGFGAAFASRYGNPAEAIMARWAPPVPVAHDEAPKETPKEAYMPPEPPKTLMAQAATDTPPQSAPSATVSQKETKDVPSTGASAPADPTSVELARSLQGITHELANISAKLDQLKSGYDQKLREQTDALQQLKTAQEKDAGDKERMAAQIQAMQAQLAGPSAKPAPQALPQAPPKKENDAAVRPRQSSVAFQPPRPRRPSAPWRPRPYMDGPYYDDGYW